jgi:hypothetical protein
LSNANVEASNVETIHTLIGFCSLFIVRLVAQMHLGLLDSCSKFHYIYERILNT